jgi:hypothetical protein
MLPRQSLLPLRPWSMRLGWLARPSTILRKWRASPTISASCRPGRSSSGLRPRCFVSRRSSRRRARRTPSSTRSSTPDLRLVRLELGLPLRVPIRGRALPSRRHPDLPLRVRAARQSFVVRRARSLLCPLHEALPPGAATDQVVLMRRRTSAEAKRFVDVFGPSQVKRKLYFITVAPASSCASQPQTHVQMGARWYCLLCMLIMSSRLPPRLAADVTFGLHPCSEDCCCNHIGTAAQAEHR